ncbi:MAG: hypothetical protein WCB85_11965 [Candidatus Dormiibacterota bacterium]
MTRWMVGGGMALALVAGGATAVGAAPWGGFGGHSHVPRPAVAGTVSAAPTSATSGFKLTAWKGTAWTADTSSTTTYEERGVTAATWINVGVNDQVEVFGTVTAANTVDAGNVVIVQRPVVAGTVTVAPTSDTSGFTITARKGTTWTVSTTSATTYQERGVSSPTWMNVAMGDQVVVFGTKTGTDTVSATAVTIIQRPVVMGKVLTAPTSDTSGFTLTTWKGTTWTVTTTATTGYTEWRVSSATWTNVGTGDEVIVFGTSSGSDTVTATSVVILPSPPVPHLKMGTKPQTESSTPKLSFDHPTAPSSPPSPGGHWHGSPALPSNGQSDPGSGFGHRLGSGSSTGGY